MASYVIYILFVYHHGCWNLLSRPQFPGCSRILICIKAGNYRTLIGRCWSRRIPTAARWILFKENVDWKSSSSHFHHLPLTTDTFTRTGAIALHGEPRVNHNLYDDDFTCQCLVGNNSQFDRIQCVLLHFWVSIRNIVSLRSTFWTIFDS